MRDDLDIFICAHKDFKAYPTNDVYKIIHGNEKIDVPLRQYSETHTELSDLEFSLAEGSRIYWLYKNYKLKKYIGICHYRKYFSFFDKIPDIEKIFSGHDIIVTKPQTSCSVIKQYSASHRTDDLIDLLNIIKEINPSWFNKGVLDCVNKNVLYACNMFIMESSEFLKYCEYVFNIIKEFCKRRGWKNDEDIRKYVEEHKNEYLKQVYPGNTIEYQSRVLGFLLERLTSIYISTNFENPHIIPMIITEDKYKTNNKEYIFKKE
jgi:hypothetical protein